MSKEGEGMVLLTKNITEGELHDLIHLIAEIQKMVNRATKILDKIVGGK